MTASGLVQGVFFRASLRDAARERGVTGWVRNTSDGRVEAELQGDDEAIEALLAFCRAGPGHAEVDQVEVAELQPVGDEKGFDAT